MAISLGILTQDFQVQTHMESMDHSLGLRSKLTRGELNLTTGREVDLAAEARDVGLGMLGCSMYLQTLYI